MPMSLSPLPNALASSARMHAPRVAEQTCTTAHHLPPDKHCPTISDFVYIRCHHRITLQIAKSTSPGKPPGGPPKGGNPPPNLPGPAPPPGTSSVRRWTWPCAAAGRISPVTSSLTIPPLPSLPAAPASPAPLPELAPPPASCDPDVCACERDRARNSATCRRCSSSFWPSA